MNSKLVAAALAMTCLSVPLTAGAQNATHTAKAAPATKSWSPPGAWHGVYGDSSVSVAVDTTQTRRQPDGTYKIRLRWQYSADQAIGSSHAYRTMVDRKLINCATQGFKPISAQTFDRSGKPVAGYDTTETKVSEIDWAKRPPLSSAGKAYAAVCGLIIK